MASANTVCRLGQSVTVQAESHQVVIQVTAVRDPAGAGAPAPGMKTVAVLATITNQSSTELAGAFGSGFFLDTAANSYTGAGLGQAQAVSGCDGDGFNFVSSSVAAGASFSGCIEFVIPSAEKATTVRFRGDIVGNDFSRAAWSAAS